MARLRIARASLLLLLALLLTATSLLQAQTVTPPPLLVYNAWVRPTAPALPDGATPPPPLAGTVAGVYLTIANTSATAYQLVGISSDLAAMTMLHETSVDDKGIARMRMVMTLDLPAGETVTFAPGGYHVMLTDISRDVYPGDTVALTLTFADSSGATFEQPVAALALDAAPAEATLIAANALAQPNAADAHALDVSLLLDNQGDADTLTGVSSSLGGTTLLLLEQAGRVMPYTTLDIAAQTQTVLSPDGVFIRLSDLAALPIDAFSLTLTFASGRTITLAVPVAAEEAAA